MTNIERLARFTLNLKNPDKVMTAFTAAADSITGKEVQNMTYTEKYPRVAALARRVLEAEKRGKNDTITAAAIAEAMRASADAAAVSDAITEE